MFLPAALHGIESSLLASDSLFGHLKLIVLIVFWRWLMREALGMDLFTYSLQVLLRLGFGGDPPRMGWSRPGLPLLCNLAGPVQHFKTAILDAWRSKVAADLCSKGGFQEWTFAGCFWLLAAS